MAKRKDDASVSEEGVDFKYEYRGGDPALRVIAISAGDLLGAAKREVKRVLKENRGDRLEAVKAGLTRLLEDGVITPQDARNLGEICEIAFSATAQDVDEAEAAFKIRRIYQEMLAKPESSPTAIAIASGANGVFVSNDPPRKSLGAAGSPTYANRVQSGIGGAVLGGVLGLVISGGNPVGGLVGAAAGIAISEMCGNWPGPDQD